MKTRIFKFLVVLFAACLGLGLTPQNSPPGQWQTVALGDLFSFKLPAGFVKRQTTDDVRGEYHKGETKLVFVWGHTESGAFSDRRQPWMKDYEESTTRIRGKRANTRTYSQTVKTKRIYVAELNVGNWEHGEVQLYMRIEGTDPATLELAREVFKSATFPLPPPERRPN